MTATTNETLHHKFDVVAVDPGVNFGLCVVTKDSIKIYDGHLLKQDSSLEYAWEAYNFIRSVLVFPSEFDVSENVIFILEGAAYHKTFGQVGLADVRAGFYMGARSMLGAGSIKIVPPMTVRKVVFGDGRYQPAEEWPTIHHNAADALSIALYGMDAQVRTEAEAKARSGIGLFDFRDS